MILKPPHLFANPACLYDGGPLGGHRRGMAQLDKLVDRDGFDGIRDTPKIGKFDPHNVAIQFINDGAIFALISAIAAPVSALRAASAWRIRSSACDFNSPYPQKVGAGDTATY